MLPCGLEVQTSAAWVCRGKCAHQAMGWKVGSAESQTPPMPVPLASAVPMAMGRSGTILPMWVGHELAEVDGQVVQVSKGISHWLPYAVAVFVGVGEPHLKGAEETMTTRDCKDHAT